MRRPPKGQRFVTWGLVEKVADHRPVAGEANLFLDGVAPLYADRFVLAYHVPPAVFGLVGIVILRMDPLKVEIHIVTKRGGDSPGNPTVVTDVNARRAG